VEDELPTGAEGTERSHRPGEIPPLPPELAAGQQEVRRLVDAGASSSEELRALAAKLREQRALEESAWKREVRPALIESKKMRYSVGELRPGPVEGRGSVGLALGLFAGVVLLLLIATQTSVLWLLVPVAGFLVYAWHEGRTSTAPETKSSSPADPTD